MSKIIGIDLGTTNSCVALIEGSEPIVIVNEEGCRTTPSVVAFSDDEILVGAIARRQSIINSENTVYSVKRFIGSKFVEVKESAEKVAFNVVSTAGGDVNIKIEDKFYSPPEISAKVLQKLKRAAEKYLGEEVTDAVITVPAYFNDSQRQATKDAGKIAGLDVKRIINEPTAAAMAYGINVKDDQLIAVYDFGGGTFDVSVLEVSDEMVEVLSTCGDTHLGGDNIDEVIIDHLVNVFKQDTGIDVSKDSVALQRIREAAEKTKIELSSTHTSNINLPFLTADAAGPKHLTHDITRSKFEQMVESIIEKTFKSCKQAIQDAGKTTEDIQQVILVGGTTRIPMVIQKVEDFFGRKPNQGVNPDEVVALGAAIQGGVLSGEVTDLLLLDITPLSLGIETMGGITTKLIPRNTTIPTKKSEVFSTAEDNQSQVDVHVLQGEREMSIDNRTLGQFKLDGIPMSPRGIPKIEVTFDIDANGILSVTAIDKASGKEQGITIQNSSGLSENEINEMVKEAAKFEAEDQKRRKFIESENELSSLVHQAEKTRSTLSEQMNENDVSSLDTAINTAKAQMTTAETQVDLDSAIHDLNNVMHQISKQAYENTTASEENTSPVPPPDENIIDAEFV
jgi:molecular chaperone DnaK